MNLHTLFQAEEKLKAKPEEAKVNEAFVDMKTVETYIKCKIQNETNKRHKIRIDVRQSLNATRTFLGGTKGQTQTRRTKGTQKNILDTCRIYWHRNRYLRFCFSLHLGDKTFFVISYAYTF